MSVEIEAIRDFLASVEPWCRIDPQQLGWLSQNVLMRYARRGDVLLRAGHRSECMFVIRSGALDILDHEDVLVDRRDAGRSAAYSTLVGAPESKYTVIAVEDSLLIVIPREPFERLVADNPEVGRYYSGLSARMSATVRGIHSPQGMPAQNMQWSKGASAGFGSPDSTAALAPDAGARTASGAVSGASPEGASPVGGGHGGPGGADHAADAPTGSVTGSDVLRTRLGDFRIANPAHTHPGSSIQQAAQLMGEKRVSSLLILDPDSADRLVGIVTDRDMRRSVAQAVDITLPVTEIMAHNVRTSTSDTLVFDAMLQMAELDIHHLPIVDEGQVTGIITAADIMRLLQHDPIYLTADLARRESPEDMTEVYRAGQSVAVRFVDRGASAREVQGVLSVAADAMARRLITLAEREIGPAPVPYALVVLGSQGRREMGLASDQDNAIVLDDSYRAEAHGGYFALLADYLCTGLATAGQVLCPGDMMASNPQWRMTLSQWQAMFHTWITAPEPDALLYAQTFFDMRPIAGELELGAAVHAQAVEAAQASPRLHAHLAALAARREPPLGFFRGLVVERGGEYANTLDVKKGGIAAIVQMARLFGIAAGVEALGTDQRLALAAGASVSAQSAQDLRDAFTFLSTLGLEQQAHQLREGNAAGYHVDPQQLSKMERENLRDAFNIIKGAQSGLHLKYPVRSV